jgi:hypothetical protein
MELERQCSAVEVTSLAENRPLSGSLAGEGCSGTASPLPRPVSGLAISKNAPYHGGRSREAGREANAFLN